MLEAQLLDAHVGGLGAENTQHDAFAVVGGAGAHPLLGKGFVLIRKKGKLPAETLCQEYKLEYGTDILEVHRDAIGKGDKVILVDDLLATGGTCSAATQLVEQLGGEIVECAFIIDLPDLKGKEKLIVGVIFLICGILFYFFGEAFYNEASRNYMLSAFGGNPSLYKSQMEFWLFIKNIISPITSFLGIFIMIVGAVTLSKPSEKKLDIKDKKRFCPSLHEGEESTFSN